MGEYTVIAGDSSFICPHCEVKTQHIWSNSLVLQYWYVPPSSLSARRERKDVELGAYSGAFCTSCEDFSLWLNGVMLYPTKSPVEPPNPDMPEDVKTDFNEARNIFAVSPRGAAAILRLALQKLMVHLGGKGENINDDIKALVKGGLSEELQQALDSVRVAGNHAVHPGQIDFNDTSGIAAVLFSLVNYVCQILISDRNKISTIFNSLPEKDRLNIAKRDAASGAK